MNIYAEFQTRIDAIVEAMKADGLLPETTAADAITVEAPRDASHGDLSTNAAMVLAKPAQKKPRELADHIATELVKAPDVAAAEIAGPGFINIRLKETVWFGVVSAILEAKAAYGLCHLGRGRRVNVEYVSANPTGPMHVGHCRGAVFGDALANLLATAGYAVTREYYINDAGAQVDVLARSAHLRYREALGEDIGEIPAGLYPGDYLVPVGQSLAKKYKKKFLKLPEAEWLPVVRAFAIDAMMAMIRDDLAALNIQHDVFFSERSLQQGTPNRVEATIAHLRERGLIYEGRLPPPKGAPSDDWEDREQTLFRATEFGDEVDRALIKADGSYTYFASDMAYHYDKYTRDFRALINVWGADHGGYVSRMQAAVAALTEGHAELDVKLIQLVKLLRNGEPVKMSKRSGSFVTLREVVEEVGRDPVRFMMLYRKNDAALDFDFAKVTEKSRENPVFYVQYAHARGHSTLRKAREPFPDLAGEDLVLAPDALASLTDPAEVTVMKKLAAYPQLVAAAARAHEPHRVAFYLYDLASDFHVLYNRGKELPHLRFIREDDRSLTEARVALVVATTHVLAAGLAILGVSAPTEL